MRTVASLYVRDRNGRVLLVSNRGIVWKFPGGEQEKGEDIVETLAREIREELGVTLRQKPQLITEEVHPSRSKIPTRYHVFQCTPENLLGELRINSKDKVNFFEWCDMPLERELNPCTYAFLKRNPT